MNMLTQRNVDLLLQSIRNMGLNEQSLVELEEAIKRYRNEDARAYINMVLFPDFAAPARFTVTLPMPTTCFKLYENTGITANSSGFVAVTCKPKNVSVPGQVECPYLQIYNSPGMTEDKWGTPTREFVDSVGTYYDLYRLNAACIRIRYLGPVLERSGLFMGAFDYFHDSTWDEDSVVMNPFYHANKVVYGIRQVWFPMEPDDYNFEPSTIGSRKNTLILYGKQLDTQGDGDLELEVFRCFEAFPNKKSFDYIPSQKAAYADSSAFRGTLTNMVHMLPNLLGTTYTQSEGLFQQMNHKTGRIAVNGSEIQNRLSNSSPQTGLEQLEQAL